MKQLTCEMCGSTELMKQDGVFVCQTCGTKYSVEDAKKMMIEGTVEVQGTVKLDNTAQKNEQIENYLDMAKAAFDGEDIEGVVSYCDRILEIDRDNCEAWVLKAKVAGWGSTLSNIKIPQAITAAKRAINLAPEQNKYEVAAEVYLFIKSQIVALIQIAHRMPGVSGTQYIQKIMLQWQSTLVDMPYLSADLIESEIEDCKNLCQNSKSAFAPSARLIYSAYFALNHNQSYDVMFKNALSAKIETEHAKETQLKADRMNAYWKEHAEEKEALEVEKASLSNQVDSLNKEIKTLPEVKNVEKIQNEIDDLNKEKNALGLFKLKEKKAVQENIDKLSEKLSSAKSLKNKTTEPLLKKIENHKNRIKEIEVELTKQR